MVGMGEVSAESLINDKTVVTAEAQGSPALKNAGTAMVTFLTRAKDIARDTAVKLLNKVARPGETCAIARKLGTAL